MPSLLVFLLACTGEEPAKAEVDLSADPGFLDFGSLDVGAAVEAQLDLVNAGLEEIEITAATLEFVGDVEPFALVADAVGTRLGRTARAPITLAYSPPTAECHEAFLTVEATGKAATDALVVNVRGCGGEASLVATPGSIDFGGVPVGDTSTTLLVVEAANPVAGHVLGASIAGSLAFFVDTSVLPGVASPGEPLSLTVGFGPLDADPAEATLTLETDGDERYIDIPLAGNRCAGEGALDADGDGQPACGGDCNDGDATVYEGATEAADGLDNDCDGRVDEDTSSFDDDGDGFSEDEGDCSDQSAEIVPGAREEGDGIDNDCDGEVDEGTNYFDDDEDGYSEIGGDCDDDDDDINPGEVDSADGIDNDCDGDTDEGTGDADVDGDGVSAGSGDCADSDSSVYPGAPETADGVDDDCDGTVDEGTTAYDDDGDGYTESAGDCDDTDADVGPHRLETAGNGVDDDCDGSGS
ncbi:MAG: choice-of-anchor D domain-containing protein [Deltaproteobacteria bacterium]|nr:choice-of-anchor D domain-containing protein [Deltaproteobacteria bacterium]